MKTLLLFRHAKSDWGDPGMADFDRPLNPRGQKAVARMGRWMKEAHIRPEWIVSSPARRAVETVQGLRQHLEIPDTLVHFDARLYLADVPTLLEVAAHCPQDMDEIMLVGHNPGLDDLLVFLCGAHVPRSKKGKLMATTTLAQISLPDDWQQLTSECGKLLQLMRPSELD